MVVQRRLVAVWAMGLTTVLAFFLFLHRDAAFARAASWGVPGVTDTDIPSEADTQPGKALFETWSDDIRRVAILETGGTHDEVTAALVHAFGGQPDVELALMLKHQRYKMEDIMGAFKLTSPVARILSSDDFPAVVRNVSHPADASAAPQILISTTCLLDTHVHPDAFRQLLDRTDTHLLCLVHHADRWEKGPSIDLIRDFIARGRADFLGLSQHTMDFLREKTLPSWGALADDVVTRVLPPVFPVADLETPAEEEDTGLNLALQGDYSSGRRDYGHTFEQLGGLIDDLAGPAAADNDDARRRAVKLRLIGHGKRPDVPANLTDNVVFDEDLSYPDFYRVLSGAFAVLPAFASDEYLDRKASSTVPAALIAGSPMVASQAVLDAYSYLPADAVWLSVDGEDEMDTVKRFIGDDAAFKQRAAKMREGRQRILDDNKVHVGQWMDEILNKP